jgi:hypothetical protein
LCLERATIAEWQGTSEDQKDAAKPTELNMNLFLTIGVGTLKWNFFGSSLIARKDKFSSEARILPSRRASP